MSALLNSGYKIGTKQRVLLVGRLTVYFLSSVNDITFPWDFTLYFAYSYPLADLEKSCPLHSENVQTLMHLSLNVLHSSLPTAQRGNICLGCLESSAFIWCPTVSNRCHFP